MSEISHAGGSVTPQQSRKTAWSTRKLVLLALFTALSLILSFIAVSYTHLTLPTTERV